MRTHSIGRNRRLVSLIAYAGLVVMLLVFLSPLVWVVGISFKTRLQTFATTPVFVWRPTLQNYITVLAQADFVAAFVNSILAASGAVALSLCAGVPAAYAFARLQFRGRRFLFFSLLIMRMLPPIAVLLPMFVLFSRLGIVGTRTAVILAYTTFSLPLVTWVMQSFFADLPHELEEGALIDGASRYAIFRLVVLPLARPGLVAAAVLSFLLAWNDFLFSAVLTDSASRTLPVLMARYAGSDSGVEWGPMTAAAVLVIVPVILFAFAAQRHLVAGLSSGAVKG